MHTTQQQPQSVSHTIQSKSKAANQAPIGKFLQRYKDTTIQRQDYDDDELLQGKFEDTAQLMDFDEDEELY